MMHEAVMALLFLAVVMFPCFISGAAPEKSPVPSNWL